MEPKVIKKAAFQVVGYRFDVNLQEIKNERIVKQAIDELKKRANEISNRVGEHIYLIQLYPMIENFDPLVHSFTSIIGYEISEIGSRSDGTVVHSVPENLYAFYTYYGLESELQRAYDYLYGRWMEEHGYESLGYDLERWDERYKPEEPDNEIDMYVAIKKR